MQNPTDAIFHFRTSHVAFFRPIKRSYTILSWHASSGKWIRFTGDMPNLSLHRSLVTDNGAVRIRIAIRPNRAANLIDIRSRGYYLQSGESRIVVLEKNGSLPQPFNTVDYNLADPTVTADLTEEILWTTQPPPLDVPPPAPVPVTMVPLKAIPKRIAWLIAEEASKAEESCPILSEPISPVTSAVTTCFHVFDHDAINEWFTRNPVNTKCPVCRDPCLFTRAFTE